MNAGEQIIVFVQTQAGGGRPPVSSISDSIGTIYSRLGTSYNADFDVWLGVAPATNASVAISVNLNAPIVLTSGAALTYSGVKSIGSAVIRIANGTNLSIPVSVRKDSLLVGLFGDSDPTGIGFPILSPGGTEISRMTQTQQGECILAEEIAGSSVSATSVSASTVWVNGAAIELRPVKETPTYHVFNDRVGMALRKTFNRSSHRLSRLSR
jgi:hypothetical protein